VVLHGVGHLMGAAMLTTSHVLAYLLYLCNSPIIRTLLQCKCHGLDSQNAQLIKFILWMQCKLFRKTNALILNRFWLWKVYLNRGISNGKLFPFHEWCCIHSTMCSLKDQNSTILPSSNIIEKNTVHFKTTLN